MSLFQVEHQDRNPSVVSAAAMFVHEGFLHATLYSGPYEPGRSETVATWAPGTWTTFARAESCPKCGRDVPHW